MHVYSTTKGKLSVNKLGCRHDVAISIKSHISHIISVKENEKTEFKIYL